LVPPDGFTVQLTVRRGGARAVALPAATAVAAAVSAAGPGERSGCGDVAVGVALLSPWVNCSRRGADARSGHGFPSPRTAFVALPASEEIPRASRDGAPIARSSGAGVDGAQ